MEWRQATSADLEQIMEVVCGAQHFMRTNGLNQWQSGYPDRTCFLEDMTKGGCWVLSENGSIAAVCACLVEEDPSYKEIQGKWLTSGGYGVMHRCAVSNSFRGRGVAAMLFANGCETLCKAGASSVRIDTHPENKPMRRALEKSGFTCCGTIHLVSSYEYGAARVGYEKLL